MPRLIAFPFELDATGSIASVEQDSDPEIDQQIAVGMLTRPGERITVPTFGVHDPAFRHFLLGNLQRHCVDFGPDVAIRTVQVDQLTEGREQVTISWERPDEFREVPSL